MSKKLPLSPDISYMLGIYRCNKRAEPSIAVSTADDQILERFVRIAIESLAVDPTKVLVEKEEEITTAKFYNSKMKKLFEDALDRRERIFKFRNEYSANYFAAFFDCAGGIDGKGLFIKGLDPVDTILLEKIGFHTNITGASKNSFINGNEFAEFIKPFSLTLKYKTNK